MHLLCIMPSSFKSSTSSHFSVAPCIIRQPQILLANPVESAWWLLKWLCILCVLQKVLSKDMGTEWKDKFSSFNLKPFAAASIGQVHQATLHDGRTVAVKIQVNVFVLACSLQIWCPHSCFVTLWMQTWILVLDMWLCGCRCCSILEWQKASTVTLTTSFHCSKSGRFYQKVGLWCLII